MFGNRFVEDVGNLLERKKEAIRTAQKTADVTILINNLKYAKNIENNRSNLLPQDDYIIPGNSMAVVMKKMVPSEQKTNSKKIDMYLEQI